MVTTETTTVAATPETTATTSLRTPTATSNVIILATGRTSITLAIVAVTVTTKTLISTLITGIIGRIRVQECRIVTGIGVNIFLVLLNFLGVVKMVARFRCFLTLVFSLVIVFVFSTINKNDEEFRQVMTVTAKSPSQKTFLSHYMDYCENHLQMKEKPYSDGRTEFANRPLTRPECFVDALAKYGDQDGLSAYEATEFSNAIKEFIKD